LHFRHGNKNDSPGPGPGQYNVTGLSAKGKADHTHTHSSHSEINVSWHVLFNSVFCHFSLLRDTKLHCVAENKIEGDMILSGN
jgi:hypothetical protein